MNAQQPGAFLARSFVTASLLFSFAVLQAQNVHAGRTRDADFHSFHTYCWGNQHSSDPLSLMRVREAADRDLEARGWVEMTSAGSLTLFAREHVTGESELEALYKHEDANWGEGWDWHTWGAGWNAGFASTRPGRPARYLVIDAFDSNTHQLLFRASAVESARKKDADSSPMVEQMLRSFPATGK